MTDHENDNREASEGEVLKPIHVYWEAAGDPDFSLSEESLNDPIISHRKKHDPLSDKEPKPVAIPEQIDRFTEKLEEEIGFKKSFDVVVAK